jgi:hypothetical protein
VTRPETEYAGAPDACRGEALRGLAAFTGTDDPRGLLADPAGYAMAVKRRAWLVGRGYTGRQAAMLLQLEARSEPPS